MPRCYQPSGRTNWKSRFFSEQSASLSTLQQAERSKLHFMMSLLFFMQTHTDVSHALWCSQCSESVMSQEGSGRATRLHTNPLRAPVIEPPSYSEIMFSGPTRRVRLRPSRRSCRVTQSCCRARRRPISLPRDASCLW